MPPIETMDFYDRALLWRADGFNENGEPIVEDTPTEITCRWTTGRIWAVDTNGVDVSLDAKAAVLIDIPLGSRMWEGTLDSWNGTGSSGNDTPIMVVRTFDKRKSLDNRFTRREVGLIRFGDSPGE